MKKLVFGLIALAALVAFLPAPAQEDPLSDEELLGLIRTDIRKDKVAIIGAAMDFTSDEAGKFWPIYKGYEAQMVEVGDRRIALIKDFAANFSSMTDDKARELAETAMELEAQRMKLRHDCFQKISSEISPVVAARFLQVESQLNLILDLQIAQQIPLIEKP